MRELFIFLISFSICSLSFAITPIRNKHENLEQVDEEMTNAYQTLQSIQFKVLTSTPNLTDLQDGEVVTSTYGAIFYRYGQEIFAVSGSCVTIRR